MTTGPVTERSESPARAARNRRVKLAVMIVVFGPILLFTIYHLGRGVYKMATGDPVGYQQRDHRVGNRIE